jgi:hypothetical protein
VSPNVACAQDFVVAYECPDLADEDLPALDVIVGPAFCVLPLLARTTSARFAI